MTYSDVFFTQLQHDFVAWANTVDAIRAALIAGSQVRQVKPADAYSDLDIEVFVTDHSLENNRCIDWLRNVAPVWMIVEDHLHDTKVWLILYQGGFKVDVLMASIADLQELADTQTLWNSQQRGYQVLLDKDGIAAQLPPPKPLEPPPYTPPTQEQFIQQVENYFYGAVYVAKQITRHNLWKIKWADHNQQTFLLEMLEWHAHATRNQPVDTYVRGDFMRDWVQEEVWQTLHQIFPHFDAQDSWQALLTSMALFTRLTEETAAYLHYDYPADMVAEVTHYIQNLHESKNA